MLNVSGWADMDVETKVNRIAAAVQDLERRLDNLSRPATPDLSEVSKDFDQLERRVAALEASR